MQSLEFAFDHAPIVPLSDQLDHYTSVTFPNIDPDRFYYMRYTPFNEEYIVKIDDKTATDILGFVFAQRSSHPLEAWVPLNEHVFHITPEMMDFGYKFYDYTEPLNSNVNMNGGRNKNTLRRRKLKKTRKLKRRHT